MTETHDYRIYFIEPKEPSGSADSYIDRTGDQRAVEIAQRLATEKPAVGFEVWHGEHRVARVMPARRPHGRL